MGNPTSSEIQFRSQIFDRDDDPVLRDLRERDDVVVLDQTAGLLEQLDGLRPAPTEPERAASSSWVFYPWRRTLVRLPGAVAFRRLRTDRNRNKITAIEQDRLGRLRIGVVGLSVGHAIAHTLALEGLCGQLRLADFDEIELSNLNRIPATVMDLGLNKAVVAARRVAELDPYLPVQVFTAGLTEDNMAEFFDGLDLVIEECDSIDIKVRVREEARRRGIPVLMETSDRGLFDVERFDHEPGRPLFHGLLGEVDPSSLRGLATRDKAPHVMRILQASQLSARMAASMVEIDRTVSTWPQLGGDIQLGASMVAAAVRRWGRGQSLPSGRIRVDLDESFDRLDPTLPAPGPAVEPVPSVDLTGQQPTDVTEAVVHALRLAPSGGNVQPWSIAAAGPRLQMSLVRERTSAMDGQFRGSYVAIGAASFNARVAAAAHGHRARVEYLPFGPAADLALSIELTDGVDPVLARQYPAMVKRISNRSTGRRAELTDAELAELTTAATAEGAGIRVITDQVRLAELADVLAESDRIRYLTPLLHQQMMSELRWPGRDRLDLGIDVRTLGLDEMDLAKLEVAARSEVMGLLAAWRGGAALGDSTRDRVNGSSALAVVTMPGDTPRDYLRGGSAVERVWIAAEQLGLGVAPVSPVFLYARNQDDLYAASADLHQELGRLQTRFTAAVGLAADEAPMLMLRLFHQADSARRSERLALADVMVAYAPSGPA